MDQQERETVTVNAIAAALANIFRNGSIERLPRTDTAHRFIIHVKSPTANLPDRAMNFAISDSTVAEITVHGYLNEPYAERYLRDRGAIEALDAGEDVMI